MYKNLCVEYVDFACKITFNKGAKKNKITPDFLKELNSVFDAVEDRPQCHVILLYGQEGVFCTGMDFTDISKQSFTVLASQYMATIKRMTTLPRVIIACVDGQVMAGGIGIVAAADLVVATPRSEFSLSEALWGLLPACVIPYLIRRVGFQHAYKMTLTTLPVSAQNALVMNLIDELHDIPETFIRQYMLRLVRLEHATIGNIKQYFKKMWMITEEIEQIAIAEFSRLMELSQTQDTIQRFVELNRLPWDKT